MAKNNALISGMFSCQFLEMIGRVPVLDIFVQQGQGAKDFARYMAKFEGYGKPTQKNNADDLSGDIFSMP